VTYAASFFDAVVSIQVIHHAEIAKIRRLVGELERILKVGGLLLVSVLKHQNQGTRFQQIEPDAFVPLNGRKAGLPHHYFTPEELRELFQHFTIHHLWLDAAEHYCLLATKA
jgi:cyclopropane fatty-acyl-phospholipid synthase-like methyltransferase